MKLLVTIVAAALLVAACGSDSAEPDTTRAESGTDTYVTGTVTAPPDAPPISELPPTAALNVTLQDVSSADAPATVLSTQTIELTEFPIAFELPYNLGDIVDNHTYSVGARVEAGGDLLMISDTVNPVITSGAPTSDVTVALVYIAAN